MKRVRRDGGCSQVGLTDLVFKWSLEDICNEYLYENRAIPFFEQNGIIFVGEVYGVEKIPDTFGSVHQYLESFVHPLLEETRAMLSSSFETVSALPFAEVTQLTKGRKVGDCYIKVDNWRNESNNLGDLYRTLPGDILILSNGIPETVGDLQRLGWKWTFAEVTEVSGGTGYGFDGDNVDDIASMSLNVRVVSADECQTWNSVFAVFLMNITTNRRIWNALHMSRNLEMVKEVFSMSWVDGISCSCISAIGCSKNPNLSRSLSDDLNESQAEAVNTVLDRILCLHKSSVELIWGPPGTGKTKTTATLLLNLLKMKKRTLLCAPTNTAVQEIASRVMMLVKKSPDSFSRASEMLIFGNKKRLNIYDTEMEEIYLDFRVRCLAKFFAPNTGWRHCLSAMEDTLVESVSQYHMFLECRTDEGVRESSVSFLKFFKDKFMSVTEPLQQCLLVLYSHIPAGYISEVVVQLALSLRELIDSFQTMLCGENWVSQKVEKAFSVAETDLSLFESDMDPFLKCLCLKRLECISGLQELLRSLSKQNLPHFSSLELLAEFCYQKSSLFFCTSSSSFNIHDKNMDPLEVLVIDEAAQMKECESVIPLQLPRIRHIVLVGDERQLTATVKSKISSSAGFGRSLFERLSSLGHSKHLLNIQYRMHPEISLFPTRNFYQNQILDASCVRNNTYMKCYLPHPMFGAYSFINIPDGREETGEDGHSFKNNAEVAAVFTILRKLHKAWCKSGGETSIGVISPYVAQVKFIQKKLGTAYDNIPGFSVKVRTVDGFQGGEEDIVVISTVRSNPRGSIGFLDDPKRTNVALTRARYCLWVLGNERTLMRSNLVWRELIHDAKDRKCFFNVDSDKELCKAVMDIKKECDQLDDLLSGNSMLFRTTRWKVLFSDNFLVSFRKLTSLRTKASILNLLLRLSNGWRPKKVNVDIVCERSGHVVQKFKVENFYLLCSIDIVKEVRYTQVLKIWDVLTLEHLEKVVNRLDSIFSSYTEDFIRHCSQKCLEGDLQVPRSWDFPLGLIRERKLDIQEGSSSNHDVWDDKLYIENAKVAESLLLTKFYCLTQDVVNCLLSSHTDSELSLPFELTMQEQEIVMFPKSSFILGRSGTGKTTILTMKLCMRERQFHEAIFGSSAFHKDTRRDDDLNQQKNDLVLRQLFVTVSSKLCFAVNRHVSQLKSFAHGGRFEVENSSITNDLDDVAMFKDISDNFKDVPSNSYPLIITFHKFLMMLDGTIGDSYFARFPDLRETCKLGLQSLIKAKEVNYDKFCGMYWPRFSDKLTRKLDASRVFIEIISHIKGGERSGDGYVGVLNRAKYVSLSECRVSTLSSRKREDIYNIYEDYERLKMINGEFDLADFVNDLHSRLRNGPIKDDEIDFVYIDEVQDLTMSQILLLKYICRNVEDGFVFSGDTAQTIARGIDFRFEDIRSLFYKEFLIKSREMQDAKMEKGQLSKCFHLDQNFRTHDGILKLAQSIVDLLYHYFPLVIDVLDPETSQICGEAPVILVSESDENAIMSIFGNSSTQERKFVGFGAEQVILVRDDRARNEVLGVVRGQALVLTIMECKGLEFQDVLLCDFFGTSPLQSRWRVIYEYMKSKDLLESSSTGSSPSFDEEKHSVLCSELKQLYVAITRTRQRLWICENTNDSSQPVFDYWKSLCLVQTRAVDSGLAEAMQVASTSEQWKCQGFKLLRDGNYPMAILCFERADYAYGEKLAKASCLKADADLKHASSPPEARGLRRQAAEIFEAIGESSSAAECYYMGEEYEKSGRIYMEMHAYDQAAKCFFRGRFYDLAANAYASGKMLSDCLLVCNEGKLFEVGLWYIQSWRSQDLTKTEDMKKVELDFLEKAALHYRNKKDIKSMMMYVKSFCSMDTMRKFLENAACLDELICLEEESGNFLEAARVARMKGDVPLEAEFLGKGKHFQQASMLILGYVLSHSLWGKGSEGWPLKPFLLKEELLKKATTLAKCESDAFFKYIDVESRILMGESKNFAEVNVNLCASKRCANIAGEVLCYRSLLDCLFHANTSKFLWEDHLVIDKQISAGHMSDETLFWVWNCWKDVVVRIIQCLQSSNTHEIAGKEKIYWEFCLKYLGVIEDRKNPQVTYYILYENADWCRKLEKRCHRLSFASAAARYWCAELMSVGMEVLRKLNAVYDFMTGTPASAFCLCRCLVRTFEAVSFLLGAEFLNPSHNERKALERFIQRSSGAYFAYVFPDGWLPVTKDMVYLRESEASNRLLAINFVVSGRLRNRMSKWQMGRIAVLMLGSSGLEVEFQGVIRESIAVDSAWGALFEYLIKNVVGCPAFSLIWSLHNALEETSKIMWKRERDCMDPFSFIYLVDRFVILLSCAEGHFFAAKSSLAEFLICHGEEFHLGGAVQKNRFQSCIQFMWQVSLDLLSDPHGIQEWIRRSNLNSMKYFPWFLLKFVLLMCTLHLNTGGSSAAVSSLISRVLNFNWMSMKLSFEFRSTLFQFRRANSRKIKAWILAEAYRKSRDPLVLVSLRDDCLDLVDSDTIFLDKRFNTTKDDMMKVLFPNPDDNVVCKSSDEIAEPEENPASDIWAAEVKESCFILQVKRKQMSPRRILIAVFLVEQGSGAKEEDPEDKCEAKNDEAPSTSSALSEGAKNAQDRSKGKKCKSKAGGNKKRGGSRKR